MQTRVINPDSHGQRASTICESLVAVLLLGIMAVSIYAGLASGFLILTTTREDLRATQILSQKMEGIRLCTWSQLSNCPTSFLEYYDPGDSTRAPSGAIYRGTIAIVQATNIPGDVSYRDQVRLINVSLSWTNHNGSSQLPHTRQMQTQTAASGMQNYIWGARQ